MRDDFLVAHLRTPCSLCPGYCNGVRSRGSCWDPSSMRLEFRARDALHYHNGAVSCQIAQVGARLHLVAVSALAARVKFLQGLCNIGFALRPGEVDPQQETRGAAAQPLL